MENNELYTQLGRIEYELIGLKNRMQDLIELKNSTLEKIYMQENSTKDISPVDILNELKTYTSE